MSKKSLIEVKGLGKASVDKLRAAGIETVADLARTPLETVMQTTGFGSRRSAAVLTAVRDLLGKNPPKTQTRSPADPTTGVSADVETDTSQTDEAFEVKKPKKDKNKKDKKKKRKNSKKAKKEKKSGKKKPGKKKKGKRSKKKR